MVWCSEPLQLKLLTATHLCTCHAITGVVCNAAPYASTLHQGVSAHDLIEAVAGRARLVRAPVCIVCFRPARNNIASPGVIIPPQKARQLLTNLGRSISATMNPRKRRRAATANAEEVPPKQSAMEALSKKDNLLWEWTAVFGTPEYELPAVSEPLLLADAEVNCYDVHGFCRFVSYPESTRIDLN